MKIELTTTIVARLLLLYARHSLLKIKLNLDLTRDLEYRAHLVDRTHYLVAS